MIINQIEFTPGIDRFLDVRKKGSARWIIAHIFSGWNKLFLLCIFFGTIIASIAGSWLMILIGNAIDEFSKGNNNNLVTYAILILVIGVGPPILSLITYLMREMLAQRIERDIRCEFYTSLLGKSQSFHDQQRIGDIMARATNDVRMLNFLVSPAMSLIFESGLGLVVPIIFIAILFPTELLAIPLIFTVLFSFTLRDYTTQLGPVTQKLRGDFGKMNAVLNETLSGIDVVKSSTKEDYEVRKYFEQAKGYRDAFVEQGRLQAKYIPLLLVGLAVTAALGHSVFLYLNGILTVGEIIAYVGLISSLRFPTFISIWVFGILKLAGAGADRLLETMNTETEIDHNLEGVKKEIKGKVSFDNVSFTYPGGIKPVLSNISFEIQPGQTVAIVGHTGSGKTTITKLLSRLYDTSAGKITIDDIDLRNYELQSLRKQISVIEQDIFLFSTSIFENISFGRTSSLEDAIRVAKEAQAHHFISALPNSYKTEVGERGVTLSGGERQRIAIARAFLTDPKILILDDSTSAIDSETEDRIQQAIRRILKGRTTFLITHRLSQIRWADLILVLKNGEIVAKGTHDELIRSSMEYRKIFVSRFDIKEEKIAEGGLN